MEKIQLAPGFTAAYPPRLLVFSAGMDDAETAPAGVHLRWFDPRSLSRPESYEIYRFDDTTWKRLVAEASITVPVSLADSQTNWSGQNRVLDLDGRALLITKRIPSGSFLIRFAKPVTAVELLFASNRQDGVVRAFHRSHELFQANLRDSRVVEGPGITDLLVRADVERLDGLRITFDAGLVERVERSALRPAIVLAPPTSIDRAYALVQKDINRGLRNRFIDVGHENFRDRYPEERVAELVAVVAQQILEANPRRSMPAQNGMAAGEVDAASFVSLAGLDPNVARLTASYVVDHSADPSRDWRHLLIGRLANGPLKSTVGYTRTAGRTSLPSLEAGHAEQLPGIAYRNGAPLGRIGAFSNWIHRDGAAATVLIDVDRVEHSGTTPLTAKHLALWSSSDSPVIVDGTRPVDSAQFYQLRPVDMFGRVGSPVDTPQVKVSDLDAPVPPTGLTLQLEQHGFPWTDPADLDGDGDRRLRGQLTASFRYGAGPSALSPDAEAVELRWWPGRIDTRPPDFSQWKPLTTVGLRPPATGTVLLNSVSVAGVTLPAARVVAHESGTPSAVPGANHGDVEATVTAPRLEILINRALLEPNLFAGYRCTLDGHEYDVSSSTAGVAFDDDGTVDKRLTARLQIDTFTSVPRQGAAELQLPAVATSTVASLRAALANPDGTPPTFEGHTLVIDTRFAGALSDVVNGGELAVNSPFRLDDEQWIPLPAATGAGARAEDVVGRVVGETVKSTDADGVWQVLIRVRPRDLLKLLLAAHTAAGSRSSRLYPPYVAGPIEMGIGTDADVRIDLDSADRFGTIAVAAIAVDHGGMRGPMAVPAEVRVVRPPPPPPPPPFPRRGGPDAAAGVAGIPDVRRQSRIELDWVHEPALRYEVSRALESSILAADRALWEQGGQPHHRPLTATIIAVEAGILGGLNDEGLIRLTIRGQELSGAPMAEGTVLSGAGGPVVVTAAARISDDTWELAIRTSTPTLWAVDAPLTVHTLGVRTEATQPVQVTHSQPLPNGMLRIDLAPDGPAHLEALRAAKGGRIGVNHNGTPDRLFHRLVAVREHDGVPYALCRVHRNLASLGPVDPSKVAEFEPAPNYSLVHADPVSLRRLADVRDAAGRPLLDTAFGVVTGVPLAAVEARVFCDVVPGPGRSRYFYRVRAVATSGAASAWSRPSVAFSQFPPPPEPLAQVAWHRHGERLLISWQRPTDLADMVEISAVELDGRRTVLGAFSNNTILGAPRFPGSSVILFDQPIEVAEDGGETGELSHGLRVEMATGEVLGGEFIGRVQHTEGRSAVRRLSGFRCTGAVPLIDQVVIARGITVIQTVDLRTETRLAVLVDPPVPQKNPEPANSETTLRLEIRAVRSHGDVRLRSQPVEVLVHA